jgi:hypothetical protein
VDVAVINTKDSGIVDAVVADYVSAVATQVTRDFAPPWGLAAKLRFIPTGHRPPPRTAWIKMAGSSDEEGALGYHTLNKDGLPIGYVFAADDRKFGAEPSITLSHEALELLLDPKIQDGVFHQGGAGDEWHAKEACDAVEADELGYVITANRTKVRVSNFVLPDYFDDSAPSRRDPRYDFMGDLSAPFSLAPGGYQSVYVPGKGWTQRTDKTAAHLAAQKGPLSRMALRVLKSEYDAEAPEVQTIVNRTARLLAD